MSLPSDHNTSTPAPLGLTLLRDILRSLWKKPETSKSWAEERSEFGGGLFAALLFAPLLFGLAWMVDEKAARVARTLPAGTVKIFDTITDLGASGYMFALAAATALAASVAHGRATSARLRAGYEVLAARAVYIFIVLAVSGILSQIFKHLIGRARPKLIDQFGIFHFDFFSWKSTLASFPSGHTTTAFAIAAALALFLPRWQAGLLLTAIVIGVSRIAVSAHYPTDVLGGMALGTIVALSVARAMARRGVVFHLVDGRLRRRGEGLVGPAVRALFTRRT